MCFSLLIDVGNSTTKFAWVDGEKISKRRDVTTKKLLATGDWSGSVESFSSVTVCSVVPAVTAVLRALFGPALTEIRHDAPLGIDIDYPDPQSIGPDRLANAVAAAALFGSPAVVVDFGTAVTFDIINEKRAYVGGVIAPGLGVFTDYLAERTALLPKINLLEPQRAIGRSTEEAMRAGAVLGYRGLITEILRRVTMELDSRVPPHVVATGGHARLIVRHLPEIPRIEPDLTLHGIRLAGLHIRDHQKLNLA